MLKYMKMCVCEAKLEKNGLIIFFKKNNLRMLPTEGSVRFQHLYCEIIKFFGQLEPGSLNIFALLQFLPCLYYSN